jgi:TPR repeat protein
MKRIVSVIVLFTAVMITVFGKELTTEQKGLRLEIVKIISAEGYKPQIDSDGDVYFKLDDEAYYIEVNPAHEDPFLISLYQSFRYDEEGEGIYTQKNMHHAISLLSTHKCIKLFCENNVFDLRIDMYCKDISLFKSSFHRLMSEIESAKEDLKSAFRNLPADIDMNNQDVLYIKAYEYFNAKDYEKAIPIYRILASENYTKAYTFLGFAYKNGFGVEKNEKEMVSCYEKALENGDSRSAFLLAEHYHNKKSYEKALDYYGRCGANENAYQSQALYKIGNMYEEGIGVNSNREKAILYYKKSVQYSNKIDCDARVALARLGEEYESKSEFTDATKTMLLGLSPEDMYKKGLDYEEGNNKYYISLPKAYAYIKAAADANYTKAYLKMGEIYRSKFYPFNDIVKSDKYYQKAMKAYKQKENSDGYACYELGKMYKSGLGVDKNEEQAKYYFKAGALKEDAYSCYEYGLTCKNEMDYPEAFKYFQLSANKEYYPAMLELAISYEKGYGVTASKTKAIEYYKRCLNANSEIKKQAKTALESLEAEKEKF